MVVLISFFIRHRKYTRLRWRSQQRRVFVRARRYFLYLRGVSFSRSYQFTITYFAILLFAFDVFKPCVLYVCACECVRVFIHTSYIVSFIIIHTSYTYIVCSIETGTLKMCDFKLRFIVDWRAWSCRLWLVGERVCCGRGIDSSSSLG